MEPTSLPSPSECSLSEHQLQRIAAALQSTLATDAAPARPAPATGEYPLKQSFQRGIRKLQADLRRRAERPLDSPPARPLEPSAEKPPSAAAWQILSTGTSRTSAPLVERLLTMDTAALITACPLAGPIDLRFRYQWVRAQYATDDHGSLSASPVKPATDAACLIDLLTKAQILGSRDHGPTPWTLDARLTPSQESSP